jgi:hypothetical protein
MFIIQNKQTDVFRTLALKKFEDEMVEHVKEFFPNHFIIMQDMDTRYTIRYAYFQAKKYGFNTHRNVCLYLNTMLILGSNFDNDPQYPWAQSILHDKSINSPMFRIDKITDKAEEMFDQIAGPEQIYLDQAYRNMCDNNHELFQKMCNGSLRDSPHYLRMIFAEKYEVVGTSDLKYMIRYGISNAVNYNITSDLNMWVYVVFMFLLGSGYDKDPQFPWAGKILGNTLIRENKKVELLSQAGIKCLGEFLSKLN